ncbi:MAG: hypothetical protein ACOVP5_06915 [Chitinophagales bacterium]
MKKKLAISIFWICCYSMYGQSVPTTTDCSINGDFENGSLLNADWVGRYKPYGQFPSCNDIQNDGVTYIIDPTLNALDPACFTTPFDNHYKIVSAGNDPLLGPLLRRTHNNSNFALKLGNSCIVMKSETMAKKYMVTTNNANFSFWYAVVLQNHDNNPCESPVFGVRLYVGNSSTPLENFVNLTGNGFGFIQYAPNLPFYNYANVQNPTRPNAHVMYSDWRCGKIDLSQFIGNTVTVEFYTKDCRADDHFGYAYIDDISCDPTVECAREGGIRDLVASIPCSKYCFNYFLPKIGSNIGTVEFILRNYNSANQLVESFSSGVVTGINSSMQSYCFNDIDLTNGTVKVEAKFSLNGMNWSVFSKSLTIGPECAMCCKEDTIYSMSKFGYNRSLPVVVANNARYSEIDFCSFEENNFVLPTGSVGAEIQYDGIIPNNLPFATFPTSLGTCITNVAHTGSQSLLVNGLNNQEFIIKMPLVSDIDAGLVLDANKFVVIPDARVESQFRLLMGRNYKLRVWIKTNETVLNALNFINLRLRNASSAVVSTINNGSFITDPIEGWRLFEISIPNLTNDTRELVLTLRGGSQGITRFFDDLRIMPEDATGKSFVYQSKSLKLISELDENHFATFYDYDEAGNLIRLRKETEKGIVTIKESSFNYQKKR